jgi:hypothetical protein
MKEKWGMRRKQASINVGNSINNHTLDRHIAAL